MSTPDLPPEALPFLREAENQRKLAMEFAINVGVCPGVDGASPHYVRIGDGGERTFLSLADAANLPLVDHFLYHGPPPLRIIDTYRFPDVCGLCEQAGSEAKK